MSADLVRESLRVNQRYLDEVVIPFGLCPWADRALRSGQVMRHVITDEGPAPEAALPFIDQLESAGAGIDIGLYILPRLALPANELDRYTERLRQADRARRAPGVMPSFVLAAFHPFPAASDFKTPYQLVSFIRRTPDPTIQMVRASTLDEARRTARDVSDQIAEQNFRTVAAAGRDRLAAIFADIRRDRDEAYARVAAPVSSGR